MTQRFTLLSRVLHWTMAAMVLSMLFIGVAMVASLDSYHVLLSIHKPLGIAILVLVVIRYVNRRLNPPPPFLDSMPLWERRVASISELFLYALMCTLPLVGWAMLSAARYPVVMFGSLHLPPILPQSAELYTVLRKAHTVLAYLLFGTFFGHLSAVLFHTLILRDGILDRMAVSRQAKVLRTPGKPAEPVKTLALTAPDGRGSLSSHVGSSVQSEP